MPYKDHDKALAHARMRYAARRDYVRSIRSVWRAKNKSKIKEYSSKYYTKHRESIISRNQQYRQSHALQTLERTRRWWSSNPEKRKQYAAKTASNGYQPQNRYRESYPEKCASFSRNWKRNNPEKVREQSSRRRASKYVSKTDSTADAFYKFVRLQKSIPCYYCGTCYPGPEMHVDHVMAVSKHGNHASDNLCASCPKCNLSKNNRNVTEWSRKKFDQPLLDL